MRILYIIDRGILGGIQRHVQCLANSLRKEHDVAICITAAIGPLGEQLIADGHKVYALHGRNGHDFRILPRFEKMLREFRPDVIHAHVMPILGSVWLNFFHSDIPLIQSLHMRPGKPTARSPLRLIGRLCRSPDYLLPVSQATWDAVCKYNPNAVGEVFYNPIVINDTFSDKKINDCPLVGMVGRNVLDKGWAEFAEVTFLLHGRIRIAGVGTTQGEAQAMLGSHAEGIKWMGPQKDGRAWISQMDLFIMTSKYEQLPTVVLECFAERTPICGFVPEGGMAEILSYSKGPLKEVFIGERDCRKLAQIAQRLIDDASLRNSVVEDGWQIVSEHFNAEKNCRGQLAGVYQMVIEGKVL